MTSLLMAMTCQQLHTDTLTLFLRCFPSAFHSVPTSQQLHNHGIQGTRRLAQPPSLSRTVEITLSWISKRSADLRRLHDCRLWISITHRQAKDCQALEYLQDSESGCRKNIKIYFQNDVFML